MATDDFFRARIEQMIDLSHPLAVLAQRMPWGELEKTLAPVFAHRDRQGRVTQQPGLFGPSLEVAGAGVSNAGRPRLPIRLMVSLLYLKHAFNLSDEALVERWSENVLWQYFSGREYYEHRRPCDATQIGRFRKLYAMHAPEVECISKGKAQQRYEFGVKTSIVCTHRQGLVVGARTFAGNPYDGHVLNAQLEQTGILLQDVGRRPREVIVDLGYRGVDQDNPDVKILHRGRSKSMTKRQRKWVRRRQAIEPLIGHLKADHRLDRCWLKGAEGDALHAVLCAAGYNLRWLLRAVARLGLGWFFALCALLQGLLLSVAIRRPGPAALLTCC